MKKYILAVCGAAVLAAAVWIFKQSDTSGKRAILYQTEPDRYYCLTDEGGREVWDESWNNWIVVPDDQFDDPASISMNFSRDEDHLVLVLSENYEVTGRWSYGAGRHTLDIHPGDSYIYIPVHDEEAADMELTGNCQEFSGEGKYRGKNLSVLGDSISAYAGYLTENCFAGYHPGGGTQVTDMWWYEMARLTGMNICAVNASGGSGVTDLGDPLRMGNSDRCLQLDRPGCKPDVICILLGINDFFAGVEQEQFEKEYREMLEKIIGKYSDAEIFLCTYFELPGEYKAGVDDLNRILSEIAEEYAVNILDLHGCRLSSMNPERRFKDYDEETGHGVQPNAVGQRLMGRWGAELLNSR